MKKKLRRFLLIFIPLLVTAFCSNLNAQTRTISGIITNDKNNESLIGASVIVVGDATKGTVTDENGVFSFDIPNKNDVKLKISFVGYESTEILVGTQSKINIKLTESKNLDEVVIVGYAPINKRDVLGAISSISEKQLADIPISNAAEALAGRLAGVQVTSSEGAPGSNIVIRIRGGGSITQDNNPIYIIDGIQVENALSVISPQDIASIDVLKDASSTAIYGARGANGVIIITMKSGKSGKTRVSYNGSAGYRQVTKKIDVLNPYDFVAWQYERAKLGNDSTFGKTYGQGWDTLSVYKNSNNLDWQKQVFGRDAMYQNHNLNINGGTDNTSYNLSLTSNNEDGILLESGFDRKLVNFKVDHKANDRFKLGVNVRYLNQTISGSGTSSSGTRTLNNLRHAIQYRPLDISTAPSSDQFDQAYFLASSGLQNPVLETQSEYRKAYTNGINFSGYLSYELFKNLIFRSTFGYDNTALQQNQFHAKTTTLAQQNGSLPIATIDQQANNTVNNSNILLYTVPRFGKNKVDLLLGEEIYQTNANSSTVETRYFPSDISPEKALANMNLGAPPSGTSQPRPLTSITPPSRIFSVFGRANYNFDDKFLASFSARADRSTKFQYDNGLLLFPAGSVAYRFTTLDFLKNNKILTEGKLRFGFGTAGNNRIGDLLYAQLYGVTGEYALNHSVLPAFAPSALANPNLKWESTESQNLGLDLGFFNNRIQLTIDAYQNKGRDLLLSVAIPPTSGYTSQLQNVGATSNRGLEFQLYGDMIKTKDFRWTSNFNIAFNRNRIESLGGLAQQTRNSGWQGSDGADDFLVQVGAPVGQIYGFQTDGWYTVADFDYNTTTGAYTLKKGIPNSAAISGTIRPGSLKIKDTNGDGLINTDDRSVIGNSTPNFTGGWNNQFAYKGFDFSMFFNFVVGGDIYNANNIEWSDGTFPNLNLLAKFKDRWTNIDPTTGALVTAPDALTALNVNAKIWSPANAQRYFVKSSDIEDGSFLRLNNITLGYTLPKSILSRIGMSRLRIYATVNNVKVFTNYSGFDPEMTTRLSDPLTPGVDYAGYPRARTYVFGVNATF